MPLQTVKGGEDAGDAGVKKANLPKDAYCVSHFYILRMHAWL